MTFLQPWLLWGLPVILLPVLIHLLNRLRYRSVKWAAIMFLVSATRSSTQSARLRHYLLMACRMLILLLIILAMSRPLVGGWLGMAAGGSPDTVVLLLDRSASMEAVEPGSVASKRAQALQRFAQSAREGGRSSRLVLIENVLRTPLELQQAAALENLTLTAPTDTAADLPAMFRAAIDYIIQNKTGRTEIWVASDFQESNWKPTSREWQTLSAQLAGLSQDVRVCLLGFTADTGPNRSLSLQSLACRARAGRDQLGVVLDIRATAPPREPFPLTICLNGARSQVEVAMQASQFRYAGKLDLAGGVGAGGWGQAEIPADANGRDNVCYFAYGAEPAGRVVVVAENLPSAGLLRAAAASGTSRTNQACETMAPTELRQLRWHDLALLVWQAEAPDEAGRATLQKFVEEGGTLLCLPPGRSDKPGPFGLQWGRVETAAVDKPFRVASWEEHDGPLSKTENGANLPLSAVAVTTRQLFSIKAEAGATPDGQGVPGIDLAVYADGAPFLQSRPVGRGRLLVGTTLPQSDWSSLHEGTVLVPLMQRLRRSGSARLADVQVAVCGAWRPAFEQELWTCVDATEPKDFRWQAGVYQCGAKRVALNRPEREELPEVVDQARLRQLFGEVRLHFVAGEMARETQSVKSEVWFGLVCLVLLGMLVESALLLEGGAWRRTRERRGWDGEAHA
jgi:hypothetical protein